MSMVIVLPANRYPEIIRTDPWLSPLHRNCVIQRTVSTALPPFKIDGMQNGLALTSGARP
jgi:hypothetical protein